MKMKKILAVVLSLSLAVGMITSVSAANNKEIKIGVFEPQTGENGGGGLQEVIGVRYANKLYPTIKIKGETYDIKLVEVDNKSDKTEAVTAAQKLVAEKVSAVVGSYGSGVSIAAGETFNASKIPAVGCSCTNPQVTFDNEYYFRVCFLDPFQGTVMANYCEKNGYKTVAVLTQIGDDYSEGLGNFFIKACEKKGIKVVATEKFQTNTTEFSAQLSNIKKVNPDFLFAPSSIVSAPLILSQAKKLGLNCQIGAGDTWENGTIIENASGAAEGMVLSTFYDENSTEVSEEGKKFLNGDGVIDKEGFLKYINTINEEDAIPAVSALGYDAYYVIYKAIEKAQSTKGEDIKNALKEIEVTGVTGKIKFDENGDAEKNAAYIKTVKDSKFVFKDYVTIS